MKRTSSTEYGAIQIGGSSMQDNQDPELKRRFDLWERTNGLSSAELRRRATLRAAEASASRRCHAFAFR